MTRNGDPTGASVPPEPPELTTLGLRVPRLFDAPRDPVSSAPIRFDDATPARLVGRVLAASPHYTVAGALLVMTGSAAEARVPVIIGRAVDRGVATGSWPALLGWLVVLGMVYAVYSVTTRLGGRLGFLGMMTVQHRLRTQLTDRLLHPGVLRHGEADGAVLSIATTSAYELAATRRLFTYAIGNFTALVVGTASLFAISVPLGLAVLAGAALLVLGMAAGGGALHRRMVDESALTADAVAEATDLLGGYRVLKGLRAEDAALARYRRTSRLALAGTLRAATASGVYVGVLNGFGALFTAGLSALVGWLALRGRLDIGELIAAVGLILFLLGPLTTLPQMVGNVWALGTAAGARVLTLIHAPLLHPEAEVETGAEAEAMVEGEAAPAVTLRLAGLSLEVAPGECVGVVADQPTADRVVKLLAAASAPEGGETVRLDGRDLGETGVLAWRRRLLVAPHRAQLFDATIRENLETPGAGDPAPALAAAAGEDIVQSVPGGLDGQVGEGGLRLSGGQRQRIALARAYAAPAPGLVLHDPTTAVDSATEQAIAAGLRGVRGEGTTLLFTASPALLAVCDRVVEADARG